MIEKPFTSVILVSGAKQKWFSIFFKKNSYHYIKSTKRQSADACLNTGQDEISSEASAFQRVEVELAKPFLIWHVTKTSH